jgi:hypothetical protein
MSSKPKKKGEESPEERAANEQVFKDHNDWLKKNLFELFRRGHNEDFQIHFVCECSDTSCEQRVDLTVEEYNKLRSMERCFVVIKGHQQPDIEQTIGSNNLFEIVQKGGIYA